MLQVNYVIAVVQNAYDNQYITQSCRLSEPGLVA